MFDMPENFSEHQKQETSHYRPDGQSSPHYGESRQGEPAESPSNTIATVGLTFEQAMRVLIRGGSVQRISWPDHRIVITFVESRLAILLPTDDNLWHPLSLTIGDVTGTDWREV